MWFHIRQSDMPLIRRHTLAISLLLVPGISAVGCSRPEAPVPSRQTDERADSSTELPDQIDPDRDHPTIADTDLRELPAASHPSADDDPGPAYRIPKAELQIDSQRLAAVGIHLLQSKRLILLTDRDPDSVRNLPKLANDFYEYLVRQCGPLRPSRSGSEFQAIGCLMQDQKRFEAAGLVPGRVVEMVHGQQLGYRFWMRDQEEDYYRRHLLLHEFAHVYMTCDTGLNDIPPAWFMEGAAEVFATHIIADDGPSFGIIPTQLAGMEDWGRISTIRRQRSDRVVADFQLQSIPSINEVRFPHGKLAGDQARYAWWWAYSWMLKHHPKYSDHWDTLCHARGREAFQHHSEDFGRRYRNRLAQDWLLFADSLCEAFDAARSFPRHRDPEKNATNELVLDSALGWQDTGWTLKSGDSIQIQASGRCSMNHTSAPWIAEPNGITLEYNQGRPIGEVLAICVTEDGRQMSRRISVGYGRTISVPQPCRVWLQINDNAASRTNNSGSYTIQFNTPSLVSDP